MQGAELQVTETSVNAIGSRGNEHLKGKQGKNNQKVKSISKNHGAASVGGSSCRAREENKSLPGTACGRK